MTERTPPEPQNQIDLRDKAVEEATGGNGPKAVRFNVGENSPDAIREKERKERAGQMMAAQMQLATQAQITSCLTDLADLRDDLYDALAENADLIERLKDEAAKLEDGTTAFLMADGRFKTADGQIFTRDQLAEIPDDPSTWSDYKAAIQRGARLTRIEDDVINPAEEKLRSGDATTADIDEIEAQLEQARRELKGEVEPDPEYNGLKSETPVFDATPLAP